MEQIHQQLSTACFNQCWDLIDKTDRAPEDVENMLLLSYASLWHWKQRPDQTPTNLSVGYWQASRVNALAGLADTAEWFARRCLEVSVTNLLPPFYVGYAYEAAARASLVRGARDRALEQLRAAGKELAKVTDEEERKLLQADLAQLAKALAEAR
jgi:hypothetical protein